MKKGKLAQISSFNRKYEIRKLQSSNSLCETQNPRDMVKITSVTSELFWQVV